MKPIPTFSADLIEQLDKDEPKLYIKPNMTTDEIMWAAARRKLIDDLVYRLEKSGEQSDNKTSIKI